EVWQHLELFWHGAVAFSPYRATFQKLIGLSSMRYVEIYNASEGFFGIQDTNEPDEMLLLLDHGVFYEFVPMEDIEKEHPRAIGLEDVELEKNYAVIITTNAGLWRYNIGDVIKFTHKEPFRFKIVGRTKQFINAFGEELMVDNAEVAIAFAAQQTGALVRNYTAAPIYLEAGKRGGHEWIIEFEQLPDDIDKFTTLLDEKLRQVNGDYDAKRYKDIALVMPVVHIAPQGTFYEWLKRKNKLGGQHKVPRLANHRQYLEDVLSLIQQLST
ncbi:MAG: GH3 auxin-responsive promoter family protein, partial [Flammeovirgaceae bacterium]|nr:GH3 auxin-responsive promoter family protein [Flammeovirgaceae bacterium]MDW8288196.1 GH3 auxin-responsive promoter family protein [Flammeovirgaceae bacterium]